MSSNTSAAIAQLESEHRAGNGSRPVVIPYACVFIHTKTSDFLTSATGLFRPEGKYRDAEVEQIVSRFKQGQAQRGEVPGNYLVTLSARSGLDLWLQTKKFKRGSYVLVGAINIPSVLQVIEHHGLVPVPIDMATDTISIKTAVLERTIVTLGGGNGEVNTSTHSTATDDDVDPGIAAMRAAKSKKRHAPNIAFVLVPHLWGRQVDVDPVAQVCNKYNIEFIEDVAESFRGFEYAGHKDCSLMWYSYGAIKTCTALGGAVLKVRDADIARQMGALHEQYTPQLRKVYASKIMSAMAAYTLLNSVTGNTVAMEVCNRINFDPKPSMISILRGFPGDLIHRIRHKPSTALLTFMRKKLLKFNPADFRIQNKRADLVLDSLPDTIRNRIPGVAIDHSRRGYWLFPLVVEDPARTMALLNKYGVESYRGATQLALVPAPDAKALMPEHTVDMLIPATEVEYLMSHVIYMPLSLLVPSQAMRTIAKVTKLVLSETEPEASASTNATLHSRL